MKVTRFSGDCCTFNNLTLLRLEGCRRCEEVPMVGHLPLLEKLEIVGLENVRYIGDEMYGSNGESTSIGCRLFPSLKTFELRFMNSLVEWMVSTTSIVFPCLEKLHIVKCPKLRRIPIGHLSSLTMFSLVDCDEFSELLFDEGCPLTSLQSLHINGCGNFSSFPSVQGLISLRSLGVINCNKLTSLPRRLGLCSSLYLLIIDNCQELTFVPEDLHELPSLDNLIITSCPKVGNFTGDILRRLTQVKTLGLSCYYQDFSSIQDIPSLDRLTVIGEKDFTSLPDQLQSLTALKNLSILEVNGMEALPEWLGNLSSLESINIKSLRNLKHLPSATALQGLTKLRQLTIQGCPFLKKSYMNRSGSEWCKISHIPNIIIDGEVIKASQN